MVLLSRKLLLGAVGALVLIGSLVVANSELEIKEEIEVGAPAGAESVAKSGAPRAGLRHSPRRATDGSRSVRAEAAEAAEAADAKDGDQREAQLMTLSKRELVTRMHFFDNVFKCLQNLFDNIMHGKFHLPEACCRLPLVNMVCRARPSSQRVSAPCGRASNAVPWISSGSTRKHYA